MTIFCKTLAPNQLQFQSSLNLILSANEASLYKLKLNDAYLKLNSYKFQNIGFCMREVPKVWRPIQARSPCLRM